MPQLKAEGFRHQGEAAGTGVDMRNIEELVRSSKILYNCSETRRNLGFWLGHQVNSGSIYQETDCKRVHFRRKMMI